MSVIRQLLQIYFTPAPYYLYTHASRVGNMAYAGIGLGLINSQKVFWVANCGTGLYFYYSSTSILYIGFIGYLYYYSISKSLYLLGLKINNTCD